MRTPRILAIATAALLSSRIASANLILNGGNELPLVDGNIPSWTEVAGTSWGQRWIHPTPYEGFSYFHAGSASEAELMQDVGVGDLVGMGMPFEFIGFACARSETTPDTARIVVEYRGAGDVLAAFDSGEIVSESWQRISDRRFAPAGTDTIRIRLISTLRSGTTNDGYYDALSLALSSAPSADLVPDGTIDGEDYSVIDAGFLRGLSDPANGDLNNDGVINGDDYFLLDAAYLGAPAVAAVPEPEAALLLAPILGLITRRPRRAGGGRVRPPYTPGDRSLRH